MGDPPLVASTMATQLSATTTTPSAARPPPSPQTLARPPGTMETEPGSVSSFSATGTTATEPGGMAQTAETTITMDIPSANQSMASRRLQHSQSTRQSYAQVTNSRHRAATSSPLNSTSPHGSPSPPKSSSFKPTETTRLNRTQVLRRLPYNTSTTQIIANMTGQLGHTEDQLFERVLRDPRDPRRFYVTYKTEFMKRYATRKGFHIGHIHIKPTDGTTTGYIPFPPYYIDEKTLQELLAPYGRLVMGDFVKTKLNTRIAGYKFSIELHKEVVPPTTIEYNGYVMDIKYDDDLRKCKYCGRYGHLIGKCRTKANDDNINQQRRAESRDSKWTNDHKAIDEQETRDRKELYRHYEAELTALADVHQATLITIEGAADASIQKDNLDRAFIAEQDELQQHYEESESFLQDELQPKREKIDSIYTRAGGVIPPDPDDSDEDEFMDDDNSDDERINRAEKRIANQIRQYQSSTAQPTIPEAETTQEEQTIPPLAAPKPKPTINRHHKSKSVKQPKTYINLPKSIQDKLTQEALDKLPDDYDYQTNNKFIIRLKTDTPYITRIIRSHLFDIRSKSGYEYINPMETTVCTLDTDETQRIIYVRDADMQAHLTEFLHTCHATKVINFLAELTHSTNPTYNKDTGWE